MIVRFALDPANFPTPEEAIAMHDSDRHARLDGLEQLAEAWRAVGALVVADDGRISKTDLFRRLPQTAQAFRQRLGYLLRLAVSRRLRTAPGPTAWPGLAALHSGPELAQYAGGLSLALLEPDRAFYEFDVDEATRQTRLTDAAIELVAFPSVVRATSFSSARGLAHDLVPATRREGADGEPSFGPAQVWSERLDSLVALSRDITVIDRYALDRALRWSNALLRFARSRSQTDEPPEPCGLRRFLCWANTTNDQAHLTVFTAAVPPKDSAGRPLRGWLPTWEVIEPTLSKVVEGLKWRCSGSVKIVVLHDDAFRARVHPRGVRFDQSAVLDLDNGLELLESRRGFSTFNLNPYTPDRLPDPWGDAVRSFEQDLGDPAASSRVRSFSFGGSRAKTRTTRSGHNEPAPRSSVSRVRRNSKNRCNG